MGGVGGKVMQSLASRSQVFYLSLTNKIHEHREVS